MGRKNTGAWAAIRSMCALQEIDENEVYARAKMLLQIYRRVCWTTIGRTDCVADELVCYCGTELDGALLYLETFAPEKEKERFERRIRTLFETRWMIELVESAMISVKEFPDYGDLYFEILSKCYLTKFKYTESIMTKLLNIERSSYYDRKKEAIMVFGIALWGSTLPRLKGYLEQGSLESAVI